MGDEQVPCLLQRAHCKLPRNGREVAKELVEGVSALEIVDQCLEGDPRPDEDRLAAENLGICMNDNGLRGHNDGPLMVNQA